MTGAPLCSYIHVLMAFWSFLAGVATFYCSIGPETLVPNIFFDIKAKKKVRPGPGVVEGLHKLHLTASPPSAAPPGALPSGQQLHRLWEGPVHTPPVRARAAEHARTLMLKLLRLRL